MQKIDAPKPIWISTNKCTHGSPPWKQYIIVALLCLSGCQKSTENTKTYLEDHQLLIENATIYFDINSFSITIKNEEVVKKQVLYLQKYPEVHVMIEGYAEKGEQNPMILGYQRAIGVKETMVKKGIDSNRIRVISLANNSYNAIHAHEHDANMKMTLTTIDFVKTYKNK